ncbi:MAG TPA: 2-phosphosulfolactate phosphatase [Bacillales bacterium]|nr:2-phosphosulfolactate phosphatase [Bacillales bacterium]
MAKCHLLMKKEDIDGNQLDGKIAVVFDVLLATSTITAGLYHGAKEVVPVLNGDDALAEAADREESNCLLVGEYEGLTLKGFLNPSPLQLKERVRDKTMILSTTNGTVAVRKATPAKKVYVASLLNGEAVAKQIKEKYSNETVVVICSGSAGAFNLEDFYGAGYFLDCLAEEDGDLEFTDAARAAMYFYRGNSNRPEEMLHLSRVGEMLTRFGLHEDVCFVSQRGIFPIVPYLKDGAIVLENRGIHANE